MLFVGITASQAQLYCGETKFDGEHKNEVEGYLQFGKNQVTGTFFGPMASYKRHFTDRWSASGAVEAPFGKGKFSLYAKGGYRLPAGYFNFYFTGKFMYCRYGRFGTNEFNYNICVVWEAPYFDITLGDTFINYRLLGDGHWEPLTLQAGIGVNIRPRWNSWNIGLYARNYDEFYYENWNINWGVRFNASIMKTLKLFGEFNIRPAGSISQLATKYETSLKVGVKYVW